MGHGAQEHAEQQKGGDEEQHGSDPHVSVNGCGYICSLTTQSSRLRTFPIPENSC
ncbi:hypothetical protein GCM10010266_63430 [Streptomyces griseomycini]|nr:hypothetical protein GCM10010266_63430 [Streptomyces griseomycini]